MSIETSIVKMLQRKGEAWSEEEIQKCLSHRKKQVPLTVIKPTLSKLTKEGVLVKIDSRYTFLSPAKQLVSRSWR